MNWYESVFELIDMRSFSNLWYWIGLAVVWSTSSHWVLGVPYDLVQRAKRQGGDASDDMATLLRINTTRLLLIVRVSGLWLAGVVFFLLTSLGLLGFLYDVEFAQAVFLIAAPISLVGFLSLRVARRAAAGLGTGPDAIRLLSRHRMAIQGIGMVSIFVTSMWGMYQNLNVGILGN